MLFRWFIGVPVIDDARGRRNSIEDVVLLYFKVQQTIILKRKVSHKYEFNFIINRLLKSEILMTFTEIDEVIDALSSISGGILEV